MKQPVDPEVFARLKARFEAEGWFVVDCQAADLFALDVDDLWKRVVMRQRGRVAMYAHYPEDPTLN